MPCDFIITSVTYVMPQLRLERLSRPAMAARTPFKTLSSNLSFPNQPAFLVLQGHVRPADRPLAQQLRRL